MGDHAHARARRSKLSRCQCHAGAGVIEDLRAAAIPQAHDADRSLNSATTKLLAKSFARNVQEPAAHAALAGLGYHTRSQHICESCRERSKKSCPTSDSWSL